MSAPTFIPDKPCNRGHLLRYVANRNCVECEVVRRDMNRERFRERWREYAARNPDKASAWKRRNPDKNRELNLAWHEQHPEVRQAARAKWLAANPEKAKEQNRQWFKVNVAESRAKASKRRAAKLQRTPAWMTQDDHWLIREAHDLAALRTLLTGLPWDVDHILPLQSEVVSGLHVPWNLRVVPATVNRSKGNRVLEHVA